MKKACSLLIAILFFTAIDAQTWTGTITADYVIIEDQESVVNYPPYLSRWEYRFIGDCHTWETGKMQPAQQYTFEIPAGMEAGFLIQKIKWYGYPMPGGGYRWSNQFSYCMDLVLPDPTTPVPPPAGPAIQINVTAQNWQPAWGEIVINGPDIETVVNVPPGFTIENEWIFTINGMQTGKKNLPPGNYYSFWLYAGQGDFEGLYLAEQKQFSIF